MVRLRSVGVLSCAKIYGILNAALGILMALFFVVVGLFGLATAHGEQKFGMAAFLVIAALSPFMYGAFGFVAGAIGALLYNWVASAIGGVEMELETLPDPYLPPAKSPAVLSPDQNHP
jgi:hypothetical protein